MHGFIILSDATPYDKFIYLILLLKLPIILTLGIHMLFSLNDFLLIINLSQEEISFLFSTSVISLVC